MRQFWLKRAEKYYQKNKWHIVADIAFVVLILLLGLTLLLIRIWRPANVVNFKVALNTEKAVSGEMVEFVIDYKAQKDVKNNSVSFNWPDNFVLESVEPAANFNAETNAIGLNDLSSGANGQIKVKGRVWGALNERQDLFFFFNCDICPNGLVESFFYNISGSTLQANWQLPETIYQGVEFKTKVELANQGDVDFDKVSLAAPADFKIVSGPTDAFTISAGEKKEVELTMVSLGNKNKADLRLQYFSEINKTNRLQGELRQEITLTENKFKIVLAPSSKAVRNGEEVVYDLRYENGNEQAINNLRFSFAGGLNNVRLISANPSLEPNSGSFRLKSALNYQGSGQASFGVVFKDKNETEQKLTLIALADYQLSGDELRYRVEAPAVKFFSRLKIKSGAYYYSPQGDQLGVGPLPPQVGMATNYWIFWEVSNSGNSLENFSLQADLPAGTMWSGKKTMSAGTFRYNDLTQRVTWSLDGVDKETSPSQYYVGFEVSCFPESANLGQLMILADNISYSAKDTFVGENMSGKLNTLSTNLDADLLGRGRGQVVSAE